MRVLGLILVAALALPPAAADAKHRTPHRAKAAFAKVHGGRASVTVGWPTRPLTLPSVVAPIVAPAAPTPDDPAAPAASPTPAPAPPPTTVPADNPHSVSVRSTEYAFGLSQPAVDAGEVKVQFDNSRAEDPHALSIDGPDPDYWSFDQQDPGTVIRYTVTLRPGSYVLFCPLPQHEAKGMHAVLTVR